MGFWVMILVLVSGAFLIYLTFAGRFSKTVKYIAFLAGLLLIAGAIFLSTPDGAEFVMKITQEIEMCLIYQRFFKIKIVTFGTYHIANEVTSSYKIYLIVNCKMKQLLVQTSRETVYDKDRIASLIKRTLVKNLLKIKSWVVFRI